MNKTIFNVYVVMESQKQCDRMKQLCIDNGLPIWNYILAFDYEYCKDNYFEYDEEVGFGTFYGIDGERNDDGFTQVTEQEFIELLKEYKNGRI